MQTQDILLEYVKQADKMKKENIYGIRKAVSKNSMNTEQIKLFCQHLELATMKRALYFTFKKSKDLDAILTILQKFHFIAGYTKYTSEEDFKIFLSYDMQGTCVIKEIKAVSSIRQRSLINTKQAKAFLNDYPYALGLIRTRNGIMTIKEC